MLFAIKGTILVSRSTITYIASWFCWDLGNPTMKSIDMCSHFHWGMGNGCYNLGHFFMFCFGLLTGQTLWNICCNFSFYSFVQKIYFQVLVHLCTFRMNSHPWFVCLVQYILLELTFIRYTKSTSTSKCSIRIYTLYFLFLVAIF